MKKEVQYKKSLRLLQKYLDETPQEQIDADIAKVEAMNIQGPTIDEYFNELQNQLQNYMKSLHKNNSS